MRLNKKSLLIATVLILAGCNLCTEIKLAEITSPESNYVAAVYQRNCGATTSYVYHVNIRGRWSWFSPDSRGVIEDGQVFVTSIGRPTIVWKDERTLLIKCDNCPAILHPKSLQTSWTDVQILYEGRENP
jgi:hypothetical protein